jgi:8-amino-7-oxononanoate synthase
MREELAARLVALEAAGLRRRTVVLDHSELPAPEVALRDGPRLINLASNDYLGLAAHPALRQAAARCAEQRGVGSGASRLVTGTLDLHVELEQRIAALLGAERALLFGSGYLAHVGAIPALCPSADDMIYSDAHNHASIVDGCRLARARVRVYPHRDAGALAALLERDAGGAGQKLIITETVFSMDGDEAPLEQLCELAERTGAWLLVDEAHTFGLRGPRGAGLAAELGLGQRVHACMGTLGKAAGAYGAFIAGCAELTDYLTNRARSFIYSTALPATTVAAGLAALELLGGAEGDRLRARLVQVSRALAAGVTARGFEVMGGVPGPILPLFVGEPRRAVALAEALAGRGLLIRAMRHPTVARGTERLRLVASAALTDEQVTRALEALAEE